MIQSESADVEPSEAFGYYPALLQLGLTYRCNLECPHCYALYRRTRPEFTFEKVREVIDEAYDLGACKVVYSHGENLIRKDFHAIARYIADKGMFQTLMANGYLLKHEEQIKHLEAAGVNKVMISLDSSNPSEHNANRGLANAYATAMHAVREIKRHSSIKCGISMAVEHRNYGRVEEVALIAEQLGADFLSVMQVRPNLPHTFAAYDWSSYAQVCASLYELILRFRGRVEIYTHDPFMNTLLDERIWDVNEREDFVAHNQCNVGKYMMSICPDGNVTGCNFIERSVGNLYDDSVTTVWQRLIAQYSDAHFSDGPCRKCAGAAACGFGCKAFHLPFETRYDQRCNSQPFVQWSEQPSRARPPGARTRLTVISQ